MYVPCELQNAIFQVVRRFDPLWYPLGVAMQVMNEFVESSGRCPDVDGETYEERLKRVLDLMNEFEGYFFRQYFLCLICFSLLLNCIFLNLLVASVPDGETRVQSSFHAATHV